MAQSFQVKDRTSNANLSINSDGSLNVLGTVTSLPALPAGTNFYTTSISDVLGVVAANNFLSLFNPGANSKTFSIYSVFVIPWSTGATTVTVSMNMFRTTAASAGTLVAASSVGKFTTTSPDSTIEVRTGNPTVTTTGLSIASFPPSVTAAAGGAGPATSGSVPSGASFSCAPGQGLVLRTASGNVNQLWNLGFIWAEA